MLVVTSRDDLAAALAVARGVGSKVGFVPTMGALHNGHASLVRRARTESAFVVVSVYVNPLQFGPGEDLAGYPRDTTGDVALLEELRADLVFLPADGEIWPSPPRVTVDPGPIGAVLEGAVRAGHHFAGVATVVAKLFNLVGPCRAYFGAKDAQQLALIRELVADLGFPVQVVRCPTVRERDGLALSSRNAYLGPADRASAPALYRALRAGVAAWKAASDRAPGPPAAGVEAAARAVLEADPGIRPEYVALVDPGDFQPAERATAGSVLALAARVGRTRLIDNVTLGEGA